MLLEFIYQVLSIILVGAGGYGILELRRWKALDRDR